VAGPNPATNSGDGIDKKKKKKNENNNKWPEGIQPPIRGNGVD
jgi:hypothetical protein